MNQGYYTQIAQALRAQTRERLQALFVRQPEERHTPWERVKTEPQRPTLQHMRAFLHHLQWLQVQSDGTAVFTELPDVKVRQFAAEARALNAAAMQALQEDTDVDWRPRVPQWPAIGDTMATAIQSALSGQATVKAALDDAQKRIEPMMRG